MASLSFSGTVFLHIGQHKTGTTSIQRFLSENYDHLLHQDILYPKAGRARGDGYTPTHHPLIFSAMNNNGSIDEATFQDLDNEINDTRINNIIISSEVLSRDNMSDNIFLGLKNLFANAKRCWIVYFRRQDELITSKYQERIKKGILWWPTRVDNFTAAENIDHLIFMKKLEDILKDDVIKPVLFDKHKKTLLDSFRHLTNIELAAEMTIPPRENERLPWRVTGLLRYVNSLPRPIARPLARFCRRGTRLADRLGLTRWLDGRGPLRDTDKQQLMRQYESSNLEFCRRYFTEEDMRFLR